MLACLSFQLFQGHQANLAKLISLRPMTLFPAMHQPHPLCKSWNMKGSPLTVCTVYSSRSWSMIHRIRGSVVGVMWGGEGREGGSWLTKNRCTIYTWKYVLHQERTVDPPGVQVPIMVCTGGEAPQSGTFFKVQVYERVWISRVSIWMGGEICLFGLWKDQKVQTDASCI